MGKKVIGLMKYVLGGKIMNEFVGLRAKAKTYAYLMDGYSEHKKAKGTNICVIKKRIILNYKDCLFK